MNSNLLNILRRLEDHEIVPTGDIITDGKKHRIHILGDKQGSQNGEYRFNGNSGYFKCYKRDAYIRFRKTAPILSNSDLNDYRKEQEFRSKQALVKKESATRHAEKLANSIIDQSKPADRHSYIAKKQVRPHNLKLYKETYLIMGLQDVNGKIHTIQYIYPDGRKRFLKNGKIKGNFHLIGGSFDNEVIITEGYATAASIHECTNKTCVVAVSANNLLPVASNLRKRLPNIKIIIAADNDYKPQGANIGIAAAKKAARAVNGFYCVPTINNNPNQKCDFNDLFVTEGSQAVIGQVKELKL